MRRKRNEIKAYLAFIKEDGILKGILGNIVIMIDTKKICDLIGSKTKSKKINTCVHVLTKHMNNMKRESFHIRLQVLSF